MTLAEIKDKLRNIEREVIEVREAVEELNGPHLNGQMARPEPAVELVEPAEPAPVSRPVSLTGIDKEPLRRAFAAMMKDLGIEDVEPIGAEALQEQMRRNGMNPEDNSFSRGIIEMREE